MRLVLTQPDRPSGRGMQRQPSPVKRVAIDHGTPVSQPVSLRLDGKFPDEAAEAHRLLHATSHDVMVVAAYGLILPRSVLDIPRYGCLNIHASLLPRWRGAAPIHRAIEAGDEETGVTIMQMEEGLDTGPMLMKQIIEIAPDDTTGRLHDRLADLGAALIVDALDRLEAGSLEPVPQPEAGVTYAAKIAKEEAAIDFTQPAAVIARRIRAFDPFPGAQASFQGTPVKIWQAEVLSSPTGTPGTILSTNREDGLVVACGTGALRLTQLQRPGGKRLPVAAFLQGFPMGGGRFDQALQQVR